MRRGIVLLAIALMAAGCSCRARKVDIVEGEIREISFMEAHNTKRCGKTCRDVYTPDTWYLNVCSKVECRVVAITHAPWEWQKEGRKVTMRWIPTCGAFGDEGWDLVIENPLRG